MYGKRGKKDGLWETITYSRGRARPPRKSGGVEKTSSGHTARKNVLDNSNHGGTFPFLQFTVVQKSAQRRVRPPSRVRASKSPSVNCSDGAPPPLSAKKKKRNTLSPRRDTKNVTKLLLARFRPPKKIGGRIRRFFLPV